MKRKIFTLMAAAVILITASSRVSATAPCASGSCVRLETITALEQQTADLINRHRMQAGVAAAAVSSNLSAKARVKSRDMDSNNYFAHHSPTYGSPFALMRTLGIFYQSAGENIAMGYHSAQDVVTAWLNSPSHKATMLSSRYDTLGIGYINGYWTLWLIS